MPLAWARMLRIPLAHQALTPLLAEKTGIPAVQAGSERFSVPDYSTYSEHELAAVLCAHAADFDDSATADLLSSVDSFLDFVGHRKAILVGTHDAIAAVRPLRHYAHAASYAMAAVGAT
jgi:hypothetical protein